MVILTDGTVTLRNGRVMVAIWSRGR